MDLHSEEAKIQMLLDKIRDLDFDDMHTIIIQRAEDKPDHTCLQAVANLKERVVRMHPNSSDDNKNARRVEQTAAKRHQNHKRQRCNPHKGKNEHHQNKNCHPNAKTVTLKNGKKIKHHHSFRFDDDFESFTKEQRKTLLSERKTADQSQPGNWKKELERHESRIVKSLMSQLEDSGSIVSEITRHDACPPGLPLSIVGDQNSQDKRNEGRQSE